MLRCWCVWILSIICFISSCSKQDSVIRVEERSVNYPDVIIYNGTSTLSFKTEGELKEWFKTLAPLSGREQADLVKKIGVTSFYDQYQTLLQSNEDSIVARGENYFVSGGFSKWKEQISPYALLRDSIETTTPIFRALSLSESNTANKLGIYLVAGSPVHVERYKDYNNYLSDEGKGYRIYATHINSQGFRANSAFSETDDRKGWMEIRVDKQNYALLLRFTAQKKSGFLITWWDRYSTTYGGRIRITELSHPFEVYKARGYFSEVYRLLNGATSREHAPFVLERSVEGEHRINLSTYELRDEVLPFGRFILNEDDTDEEFNTSCIMKGYMEVWTRGIPQHLSGRDDINIEISL